MLSKDRINTNHQNERESAMLHRCLPAFHRRAAVLQHLVSLHSTTAACSFSSKRHRPASQGGPGPSYPVERAIAPQSRRRQQQAAAQAASAPRRGRRQQAPHSKPEASPAVDITEHELALFEFIKAALRAAPDVRSFTVRVAGDWCVQCCHVAATVARSQPCVSFHPQGGA